MTVQENDDEKAVAIWQGSNDHRSVHFVNRSTEWVELKGTLKMSLNRETATIVTIPPKATYTHRFLGESFEGESSRWLDFGLIGLLVSVPDPYWLCFHKGFTWTATSKDPTCMMVSSNSYEHTSNDDVLCRGQCKLNGRPELKLNEHLGEMKPLESKTVFIDAKFVSSLQALTISCLIENLSSKRSHENHCLDLPLPKRIKEKLAELLKISMSLKNY